MCGNRVEELEARVNELQASVEGLTDELVECKVRIRELESAVDEDNGFSPDLPASAPNESESPEEEEADTTKTEDADKEDSTESETSEIIVA